MQLNQMLEELAARGVSISKDEEEVQKVHQDVATKLLEYIYMHRVNGVSWSYISSALSTVFENHVLIYYS